jgi:hypothetical protein
VFKLFARRPAAPKIAVLGSCVTRDAWRIGGRPGDPVTLSRTSLASIDAPRPRSFVRPKTFGELKPGGFDARCVLADVEKTNLARLEAARPDVIVIDFMDELTDLLAADGTIISASLTWQRSRLAGLPCFADARLIERSSAEAQRLTYAGLTRLRDRIRSGPLSGARIVLHRCLRASSYVGDPGRLPARGPGSFNSLQFDPDLVSSKNRYLQLIWKAFQNTFPGALIVEVDPRLRVANLNHRFGPTAGHFIDEYYHEFLGQLDKALAGPTLENA